MAAVFAALRERGVERAAAQGFVLGRVLECFTGGEVSGGFAGEAVALADAEVRLLARARAAAWGQVQLSVFGALLQACMDPARRHALGAHFTSEADIDRVVTPTIVRPWRARINAARGPGELRALIDELAQLRVLDPACGSGNFLYVALRALQGLEAELLDRLAMPRGTARVGARQMFGIDRDGFAVALARLTLRLADPGGAADVGMNVQEGDALFMAWPRADVIVGNPPFQAKNKMQVEFGPAYLGRLRAGYPGVPGLADYCVYWFRRAHDELAPGGRAGLVGTNTIRQNASRIGGLGFIVDNGGVIVDAVASQVWSGDAAVHVSVVNWVKGPAEPGPRRLAWQEGNGRGGPWRTALLPDIGASLSAGTEVGAARPLRINVAARRCYQGLTHGHVGFVVTPEEARALIAEDRRSAEVLFPLLTGEDLMGRIDGSPSRLVIDLGARTLAEAQTYSAVFARLAARVLPDREAARRREQTRNAELTGPAGARVNRHHEQFHERWWQLAWRRPELLAAVAPLRRYMVAVRISRRPVFELVRADLRPSDALVVFALDDDYSFGVLQSSLHWRWLLARCSTLKSDYRYTSRSVFDAFVWPQAPTLAQVEAVALAARRLRAARTSYLEREAIARRALAAAIDRAGPGETQPLGAEQDALDRAVCAAYGVAPEADALAFLLALNLAVAAAERRGEAVTGPGLPAIAEPARARLVTRDCVGADWSG